MVEQDFFGSNILLIGLGLLVVFGYLLVIIRRRVKRRFLHSQKEKEKEKL